MIKDDINPSHYKNGKIEAIDAIESAVVGKPGPEAVQVGNIIKYLWRYEDKNGLVDVKKCRWYLERLISILEEKQTEKICSKL
jgi:hypothetical protein